jgi:predicted amidohydrolase
MKAGYIQTEPKFGEVEKNLNHISEKLEGVRADLIVLPELFNTGYTFENKDEARKYSEEFGEGPTFSAMKKWAMDIEGFITGSIVERDGDKIYNTAILAGSFGIVGHYRKAHLFDREKKIFDPGDTSIQPVNIGFAMVGLMICFDWIFPEVARVLALNEAHILAHPSNLILPELGQKAMVVRSIENRVFSITANRIGTEKRAGVELTFTGRSQIVSPKGEILAQSPADEEDIQIVEIDEMSAEDKKITPNNDIFKDRRKEFYGRIITLQGT